MKTPFDYETILDLDHQDPIASKRDLFILPKKVTYLVGHSLGPASHLSVSAVKECLDTDWAQGLVGSWNSAGWFDLADELGAKLSRFIGARPDEVMVTDTVSINLFKLAVSVSDFAPNKTIYVDDYEFPTDQYMADSIAEIRNIPCKRVSKGEELKALHSGGIYLKSAVNFRTSGRVDIKAYESEAEKNGTLIVWDLSHATGIMALNLGSEGAKLATGCTYKYLNAGPGSPSFLYIHHDFQSKIQTPLPGWMGHARPFAFETHYEPINSAAAFASGTPPILSLSALKGAIECFDDIDFRTLENKTALLGDLCTSMSLALGLTVSSPLEAAHRGGHVSIEIDNAYPISRALAARGFKSDFRTPRTIRFGLSPLYIRFVDVWNCMKSLEEIVIHKQWDRPEFLTRNKVT